MQRNAITLFILSAIALAGCSGGGSGTGGGPSLPITPRAAHRTASYMLVSEECGGPSSGEGQLQSWLATATGNVASATDIEGSNTGLNTTAPGEPFLDYVDTHGIVWVSAQNAVVGAYPSTSTGNVAPYTEITGSNTTFSGIAGITTDSSGYIYVTDFSANAVDVFAPLGPGVFNVAPIRRIVGGSTGLVDPEGIAVGGGTIYVYSNDAIEEWPTSATGNVAPSVTISGGSTGIGFPKGLVLDSSGNIWIATDAPAIEEFPSTASGNVAPTRIISGANTNQSNPVGISVDSQGYVYDADYGNYTVNVYGPAESGNVAPVQTISGGNTGLCEPEGVTVH